MNELFAYSGIRTLWLTSLGLLVLVAGCGSGDGSSERTPEERGQRIYRAYCLSCHQADGSGIAGMYPPLQQTDWVEGDTGRLIRLVINGVAGPIEVKGEMYNNVMPAHGNLSDNQIADVLTFVRQSFGNDASAVTADDVYAVRSTNEQRGMWRASDLEHATGIPPAASSD
jgi:mono/diheme cytochrome c family protein